MKKLLVANRDAHAQSMARANRPDRRGVCADDLAAGALPVKKILVTHRGGHAKGMAEANRPDRRGVWAGDLAARALLAKKILIANRGGYAQGMAKQIDRARAACARVVAPRRSGP